VDAATEQIAFTGCTLKDCNVDSIDADESGRLCLAHIESDVRILASLAAVATIDVIHRKHFGKHARL
jgi:hypothetical protein